MPSKVGQPIFCLRLAQLLLRLLMLSLLLLAGLNRSGSLLNLPVPLVQKPGVAGVLSIAKGKEKQLPEQQGKEKGSLGRRSSEGTGPAKSLFLNHPWISFVNRVLRSLAQWLTWTVGI